MLHDAARAGSDGVAHAANTAATGGRQRLDDAPLGQPAQDHPRLGFVRWERGNARHDDGLTVAHDGSEPEMGKAAQLSAARWLVKARWTDAKQIRFPLGRARIIAAMLKDPFQRLNLDREVLTVSQLNGRARLLLEDVFAQVWVEGEISNLACPASGHVYFTLKDRNAQVRCALFRQNAARVRQALRDGLAVRVRARSRCSKAVATIS